MPALRRRRIDLDALWGVATSLPVATIDGLTWASAATDRSRRRTLTAAGPALATLRALRLSGSVAVRELPVEPAAPAPSVIDAAVELVVELGGGQVLHVLPHRAGGSAAVFFAATPQRCWVIDLDDLPGAATTMLTMTAEQVGDATWASGHGVPASSVRLVPAGDSQWQLGVVLEDGFLVAEPNGALVRTTADVVLPREVLARTATDLTRDAASLLAA